MDTQQIIIVLIVLLGLGFGSRMARNSLRSKPIHNGVARVLHYLAAALMTAVTPTVLLNVIFMRIGFVDAAGEHWNVIVSTVLVILAMVAATLLLLLVHAILEKPILDQQVDADRGWTEEDARTSGL